MMARIPEPKTNYAQEFPRYTHSPDYGRPVISALIEGICDVIQEQLENPLSEILAENSVNSATGQLLDYWGELVGEPRSGRPDADYRLAIRTRILRNRSQGTWDDLLLIAQGLYALDVDIDHYDSVSAEAVLEVRYDTNAAGVDPSVAFAALDQARAAGVRLHYVHWPREENRLFRYSDTDSLQSDPNRGFSDELQVTGGRLVGAEASS